MADDKKNIPEAAPPAEAPAPAVENAVVPEQPAPEPALTDAEAVMLEHEGQAALFEMGEAIPDVSEFPGVTIPEQPESDKDNKQTASPGRDDPAPTGKVVYDLDENGQRIPDGKGGWKNHREDTTDWNDKENVEIWRAAWAACTNRALESAGRPGRIDHRSYKRQGIDKIPSVHLGPAASQMEKRGIRTDKGEVNRQIAADNKLLKEIKARITRLYNWSKAEAEKPEGQQPSMIDLWEAQQQLKRPDTRTGKIRALQESAALFSFMQANGIKTMQQLHDKISEMNGSYYDLRGKIVQAERRIATLTERGEMWAQYNKYKPIRKQLAKVKPEKRELFEQRHSRELILYDAAARYLKELKDSGEEITPKAWQREIDLLTAQKQVDTIDMKAMREELKAVERLRKAADQLARQGQDKSHDRGPER